MVITHRPCKLSVTNVSDQCNRRLCIETSWCKITVMLQEAGKVVMCLVTLPCRPRFQG